MIALVENMLIERMVWLFELIAKVKMHLLHLSNVELQGFIPLDSVAVVQGVRHAVSKSDINHYE